MKWIGIIITIVVVLVVGFIVFNSFIYNEKQAYTAPDHMNAEYLIDGQWVKLEDGVAEAETAPGSASMNVTRYFDNELVTDLNDDDREDIVFIVTQQAGASGLFYYVVAALNTENGYLGSDGYLLGDRIAPQTIEESPNPRHKNVIIVNYADRAEGEPMVAEPSVGKSVYLKLDEQSRQWGVVEPEFEGESALPVLGDPIAVRGEVACLPKRGTGEQTAECAIGLKADDNGGYYALRNMNDPNYEYAVGGKRLEVIGTISYEEMRGPDGNQYDVVGVINVSSFEAL